MLLLQVDAWLNAATGNAWTIFILLYMCPHTTVYVSSYDYTCVLIPLYVSSYYYICVPMLLLQVDS